MKISDDVKIGIILAVLVVCYVYSFFSIAKDITVTYDCRLAEISVDYPQAVKEECRKMMKE